MNKGEIVQRLEELKTEKKQLKKQLKELPSLEVGKWYTNYHPHLFYCESIIEDMARGYGFERGEWQQNKSWNIHNGSQIPATDKEVEEALIKEAKKRGFKEGVKIYRLGSRFLSDKCRGGFYLKDNNIYVVGRYDEPCIFRDGKWAEIIEQPKTVTLNGDYTETQLKDILNNRFNENR